MYHKHHFCSERYSKGHFGHHASHGRGSHFGRHFAKKFTGMLQNAPVNIKELDNSYELYLYMPGLTKEEFNIKLWDDELTITHQESELVQDEPGKWLHKEYRTTSFERKFRINDKVDRDNMSAQYKEGVLRISLPKLPGTETRSQNISVV